MAPKRVPTTPRRISEQISAFCRLLNAGASPTFIPSYPHPEAFPDKCLVNVEFAIETARGSAETGWLFWEDTFILQSVAHAVWVRPGGMRLDVTPHVDGEQTTLFLPDTELDMVSGMIRNRYYAKIDHPAVQELVAIYEEEAELQQEYGVPTYLIPGWATADLEEAKERVSADLDELEESLQAESKVRAEQTARILGQHRGKQKLSRRLRRQKRK